MQTCERDLGGPRQIQAVALDRVDVGALGGEEAGAVHRLLAHEDRWDHGEEARRRQAVEREPVERQRDERGVADHVSEARARDPRRALHVEAADLGVLLRIGDLRRLADAADLHRVLLGVAVGHRRVRRVGYLLEELVPGELRAL